MQDDLIFDLGCHLGEDADFYLKKGFRVVALEANPTLCEGLRQRFADAIAAGRLTLVEKAIAETEGVVDFYVNTRSVWGTIRSEWAERNRSLGADSRVISVPSVRFESLLARFGVPHYLKIDIEGADLLCLEALTASAERPRFLSMESEKESWVALKHELDLLERLGYRRFKIIDQGMVPDQRPPRIPAEGRYVDHVFEPGSTGLFGDELPGEWITRDQAIGRYRRIFLHYWLTGDRGVLKGRFKRIRFLRRLVQRYEASWYDTHAAL